MTFSELGADAILVLTTIVASTSFIASLTGMAGGVLMFIGMNLFIPMRALIPIHGAIQIFNNSVNAYTLRKDIRWSMLWPFIVGGIIGTIITTTIIARYVSEFATLIIILGLITYTLFRPKKMPAIVVSDKNYFWVGVATGSISILAGIIDPILAAFFMREDLTKEEIVANKSVMQLFIHMVKIPAFLYLGFAYWDYWELILILSIAAMIGAKAGLIALTKLQPKVFILLMKTALFLVGIRIFHQLVQMSL